MYRKPLISIPPAQTGDKEGTWAYFTLSERFRNTAGKVIEENNLSNKIEKRLTRLIEEIPDAPLRHIVDPQSPDGADWEEHMDPYLGLDWRKPPWFLTEHYFYRRILEATGYHKKGEGFLLDPFRHQKKSGFLNSIGTFRGLVDKVQSWKRSGATMKEILHRLIFINLWGNQADLSLWPAEDENKPDHVEEDAARFVLIDNSDSLLKFLENTLVKRIDFLIDNAGFELLTDLIFADFLITNFDEMEVTFHLKAHPTYVSDTTQSDMKETLVLLSNDVHDGVKSLGNRLLTAVTLGRLKMKDNFFWNSPLDGWKMPRTLREDLTESDLVISKGDAHYRRLLGDRYWSFSTPFQDILAYYPAPILALRTSKSELIVGMDGKEIGEMYAKDSSWLINGRWGVVQFHNSRI